ncbi:TetR-like C-terminal domain-containing protein [Lysinibacillus sp. SGAir0095]|uniref:TetR-like C-terminal domain-containing protein n=1 Tax=Lysinibacillus sp. SGAir0095 TaxID=2070463 RepID=UPI00143D18AF|nr:TetR-like C-terminal domain-containing protein [Lysinibacillus sp. SGAir0095]
MFYLFLNVFIELYGAKTEHDNMAAYVTSFITYGIYGWIEEWIVRGMQESGVHVGTPLKIRNELIKKVLPAIINFVHK